MSEVIIDHPWMTPEWRHIPPISTKNEVIRETALRGKLLRLSLFSVAWVAAPDGGGGGPVPSNIPIRRLTLRLMALNGKSWLQMVLVPLSQSSRRGDFFIVALFNRKRAMLTSSVVFLISLRLQRGNGRPRRGCWSVCCSRSPSPPLASWSTSSSGSKQAALFATVVRRTFRGYLCLPSWIYHHNRKLDVIYKLNNTVNAWNLSPRYSTWRNKILETK